MAQHGMQSVGARLLGIYFLVFGISSVFPAIAAGFAAQSLAGGVEAQFGRAFMLASVAQAAVQIAAGVLLLLYSRTSHPVETCVEPKRLLWVGLKLLGAFFVVSGASDAIWGALRGSATFAAMDFSKLIAGVVQIAGGGLLWFRAGPLSGSPAMDERGA